MIEINHNQLIQLLQFPELINALDEAFQSSYTVPMRHHHDFPNPKAGIDSTLLLMPAWEDGNKLGVKIVTVSPNNGQYKLPAIQGIYMLFDVLTGTPLAQLEAKTLTTRRTAATSALASRFLSRPESSSLLMVGTGALAPNLIKAHAAVRPIQKVYIWGRNEEKAKALAKQLDQQAFETIPIKTISEGIAKADIISCATLSESPLIEGTHLRPGQHLDLVGSYKPNMREADNETIKRCSVFVDVLAYATKETGDIVIPLQEGILKKEEIKGDLFGLCRKETNGRANAEEITFFKSVGHALEDLAAAKLAYQKASLI